MMDVYIPEEIWRYILSYLPLPYTSRCCSLLYDLEKYLDDERYKIYTRRYPNIDKAIDNRNWDIVRFLIHRGYGILNYAYVCYHIGRYGSRSMISDLIRRSDVNDYDHVARGATEGDHIAIVKWMIELGISGYHSIAYMAAIYGKKDIMALMIDSGSIKSYDKLYYAASVNGNYDISNWMNDLRRHRL